MRSVTHWRAPVSASGWPRETSLPASVGIAETTTAMRETCKQRVQWGDLKRRREDAKARGVKIGPKFKFTAHQQREAIKRRDIKGEPVREIARTYNVSHSTISRLRA
jgi:Helix-turn-helix domain